MALCFLESLFMKLHLNMKTATANIWLLVCTLMLGGHQGATAQMMTPISHKVTTTGAASSQMHIAVPPGIAGIEPKLDLAYNSQEANQIAGVGWALTGLSVITRCAQTLQQDGATVPVNYTSSDRYCLDGERMMKVAGVDGGNGAEYRVERDRISQIQSYGSAGAAPQFGPAYFIVKTRDGLIMEFGNSSDSRIEAAGSSVVRSWALNKVSDRKGNYLAITYNENNAIGEYYPVRIDYTANTVTGVAPAAAVKLSYETRPDLIVSYLGGAVVKTTMRLKAIDTVVRQAVNGTTADVPVMSYVLAYVSRPM